MNLKNYTSSVPANRSIQLIEELLINEGATNINKTIGEDKEINGVTFDIPIKDKTFVFKLPSKVDLVYERLRKAIRRPTPVALENCKAQAKRTAWKILYDWVQIQVSMIQINQVEILEVFLPYMYSRLDNKTYFETLRDNNYNSLQLDYKKPDDTNEVIEEAEVVSD